MTLRLSLSLSHCLHFSGYMSLESLYMELLGHVVASQKLSLIFLQHMISVSSGNDNFRDAVLKFSRNKKGAYMCFPDEPHS